MIIDGGTSVADRDYIDAVHGSVVWFVARFASALGAAVDAGLGQHAAVHAATCAVYAEYGAHSAGDPVPQYAWPMAAMTWARVTFSGGIRRPNLSAWATASFSCAARRSTWIRSCTRGKPSCRPGSRNCSAAGVQDGLARRERLLPMLRARRAFQNTELRPSAPCLRPNGAFQARTLEVEVPAAAIVLGMTDGFQRLVDTYGLHAPETLAALCAQRGLRAAHDELRRNKADALASATSALKGRTMRRPCCGGMVPVQAKAWRGVRLKRRWRIAAGEAFASARGSESGDTVGAVRHVFPGRTGQGMACLNIPYLT